METLTRSCPTEQNGQRLDAVAARLFGDYSRSRLQSWIAAGYLRVDGRKRRTRDKLVGGELLELTLPDGHSAEDYDPDALQRPEGICAEAIAVPRVHEDDAIFVVDKPAGLVMHPAPGNTSGTLMNGLLHLDPSLHRVPRAGIVHRLDKDTSGLCVVARTLVAQTHLVRQLQAREMGREYLAIVIGDPPLSGSIDKPIGRHSGDRKRMAVSPGGKSAVTHFELMERFDDCALLRVRLETGRTHQIRVHLSHLGFPLVGDPVYGKRRATLPKSMAEHDVIGTFSRQALHAVKLTLNHPLSGDRCHFQSDHPKDFARLLAALRGRFAE